MFDVTTGAQEVVAHGESGAAAGRQGGRAVGQHVGQCADRERASRQAEGALSGQRHALTQCCILGAVYSYLLFYTHNAVALSPAAV